MNTSAVYARRTGYGAALVAGIAVFASGTATSFNTLSRYATKHNWLWGPSLPLGLDLAIFALLVLDWLRPNVWLRSAAWLLTAVTVVSNVAVTDGTDLDRGLHGLMPALAVIILEAARRWGREGSTPAMDKVRASRWLLSPIRTASLKRRMVLWEVTSYKEALTRESAILHARTVLVAHYRKESWRKTRKGVPLMLRHQLATGQVPSSVLHSLDPQPAVQAWVYATLDELALNASPDPAGGTGSGEVPSEDSCDPDVVRWDLIWMLRDRLRPDGVTSETFAQAIALARNQFEQAGTLIRNEDLRSGLRIAKEGVNAIGRVLRTSFTDGPVLGDSIQDSPNLMIGGAPVAYPLAQTVPGLPGLNGRDRGEMDDGVGVALERSET